MYNNNNNNNNNFNSANTIHPCCNDTLELCIVPYN